MIAVGGRLWCQVAREGIIPRHAGCSRDVCALAAFTEWAASVARIALVSL